MIDVAGFLNKLLFIWFQCFKIVQILIIYIKDTLGKNLPKRKLQRLQKVWIFIFR